MTAEDMNKQKMLQKLRFSNFKSESRQTTSKQSLVTTDDNLVSISLPFLDHILSNSKTHKDPVP